MPMTGDQEVCDWCATLLEQHTSEMDLTEAKDC